MMLALFFVVYVVVLALWGLSELISQEQPYGPVR